MTDAQGEVSAALGDGERAARERLWRRVEVDPVTLQVIGGAFRAIADQMAELLIRMAWSNIMRESQDIGAGILDEGRTTPAKGALFNLAFLNIYEEGRSYTAGEHRDWLLQAGLAAFEARELGDGTRVIRALKP